MEISNITKKKLYNKPLLQKEIDFVITGFSNKEISHEQIADFLRAIYFKKMSRKETLWLTSAMIRSGVEVEFPSDILPVVDKHSTGGVGDKVTLTLIPLLSLFNIKVAKMSGGALGHTGGTVDKMLSFPNIKIEFNESEVKNHLKENNAIIMSQSDEIAPIDKKLYRLRDHIGCVDNLSLIVSSIMAKKIATGANIICIDIKVGNGALFNTYAKAKKAAKMMKYIGEKSNKKIFIAITNMNQPLGFNIGNKLEVLEAKEFLKGKEINDLEEINMHFLNVVLKEINNSRKDYTSIIKEKLTSKEGYQEFEKIVQAQKGIFDFKLNIDKKKIKLEKEGYIHEIDTKKLGQILRNQIIEERNSNDVGIKLNFKIGNYIRKDDILLEFYSASISNNVIDECKKCFVIKRRKKKPPKVILKIM